MSLESQTCKKAYSVPKLNKLMPEQAHLLLIGHATCGNQGAKDLLDVIYPEFQSEANDNVHVDFQAGGSASISPRMPSLIHRALAALDRARDNFHRLVRG